MKKILVVGYPKSGSTWLARLVAELISCPVKGFFEEPENPEIAIEGIDRNSKFLIFKGHQPFYQISGKIKEKNLIYIVRDVRDVAISGGNYFNFRPSNFATKLICEIPIAGRLFNKFIVIVRTKRSKISEMIRTLDKGNRSISWCSTPWDKHVRPYLEHGVLVIRYEDLLSNPVGECKKILSQIGIKRSDDEICASIKKQSFETIKKKFLQEGDMRRANFLREGKSGVWKRKLTKKQKTSLNSRFFDTLKTLGYID